MVVILERETGRELGSARSSARLKEGHQKLAGEMKTAFSGDLSVILVHEEFSDASPAPRYILFQRPPGHQAYRVSYCNPPAAHTDRPGEWDFVCPDVKGVTGEAITFSYYGEHPDHTMRIADLIQTRAPRSWGDPPWGAPKLKPRAGGKQIALPHSGTSAPRGSEGPVAAHFHHSAG
jgi:hypothetical protein